MRVLSIDVPQGWTVIEPRVVIAMGRLDPGREVEEAAERIQRWKPDIVVVEAPLEPYLGGRGDREMAHIRRSVGASLMASARLAGRIEERCAALGVRCLYVDAKTVRAAFRIRGRTSTEKDRSVAREVALRLPTWPKRSTVDERDAGLAALWGMGQSS